MKVLQVNCVYRTGSTGKIMQDIHTRLMSRGIDSVLCYGRGEYVKNPNVYKTCGEFYSKYNNLISRFSGIPYGGCFFSTRKLISIIKKEKPDIVHLHCINGYFVNVYKLVLWLNDKKIKTVITLHAEFMYTANCSYSFECDKWKLGCGNCPDAKMATKSYLFDRTARSFKKMKRAFAGFDKDLVVVSCSPWQSHRASVSPILAKKTHRIVFNGLNTDIFHQYQNLTEIKLRYGLTDEKIILHVTPYFTDVKSHIKGGHYVIELAKKLKKQNIKILVAGRYDSRISLPPNIILLGEISDEVELAELYSIADITLLTSRKETFSMVTAESLCCGTPVVGFKAGGPESIALPQYSEFVEFADNVTLLDAVNTMLGQSFDSVDLSQKAALVYDRKIMFEKYLEIYNSMLSSNDV